MKKYYFVNSGEQNGGRGDGRMTLDLAGMIAQHYAVEPEIVGTSAIQKLAKNPHAIIFDLSSRNKEPLTSGIDSKRIFRIHIHNHLAGVSSINPEFDLYLSPEFNPVAPRLTDGKVPVIGFNCLPSRVTPENIAQAAKEWRAEHGYTETKPFVSLVIGSFENTMGGWYWAKKSNQLCQQLYDLSCRKDITVGYTTTWTTDPELSYFLKRIFPDAPIGYDWQREQSKREKTRGKSNPYLALLGLSKAVIVQGDSISVQGDAAATGKHVYILGGHNVTSRRDLGKFTAEDPRFTVKTMIEIMVLGRAAQPYFTGALDMDWQPKRIDNWPQAIASIADYAERKQSGKPLPTTRLSTRPADPEMPTGPSDGPECPANSIVWRPRGQAPGW